MALARLSNTSGAQIRTADSSDLPAAAKIYLEGRDHLPDRADSTQFRVQDFYADTQGEVIWIAERGVRVVGFVSVYRPGQFIHNLYVEKKFQEQGIGRLLVEEVAAQIPGTLRLKCILANEAALSFYEATGWVEESRGESEYDGAYVLLKRS
jgi:ribosomal protein S18 acetylase RimI-like enzyme